MENNKYGSNNDPGRIRVDAVKKFIDELGENDRASIVGFSDDPRMLINLTYDHEAAGTQADMIVGNIGGTQLYKGINMGIEELRTNGRAYADKIIIALTDGEDDPAAPGNAYDEVIANAGSDITIYTVGLGSSIATVLLTYIAESTGGHYFHAETADDLYLGYERIKDETIDYRTDSNNDGISDYYAKLIMRQELRLQNGSGEMFPVGLDINCAADLDGDGLLNGEELVIVEMGDRVMIRYVSDPLTKDSDGDGYEDNVDPHPLVCDYFTTNATDFYTLTNDGKYKYSTEAHEYDRDFWAQVGNDLVAAISFTDLQQDYTMEMVDFFRVNANEQYVNYQQMADMEAAVTGANDNLVASICKTARQIVNAIDTGADVTGNVEALTEAGLQIMNAKKNLNEARRAAKSAKSIAGYQSWVTRYVNQFKNGVTFTNGFTVDVPAFKMMTKGLSNNTAKRIQIAANKAGKFIDKTLNVVAWVSIAFDAGEVLYDDAKLWKAASAIANENANTIVFQLNNDLFEKMRDTSDHDFTRQAAQFVLDAIADSYLGRISQTLRHSLIEGTGTAVDIIILLNPQLWVIGIAKGVFDICDSIWGWSDNAQTRARVICLSDMTEATISFVNEYYLSDNAKQDTSAILGRHLENLVNLRITGETRFMELRGHENDSAATLNISEVRALATRMGLFVIP